MGPSERIDEYVEKHNDWRGEMIARLREIVIEADPDITEEWKWNSPVWSHDGLVCGVSAFKSHVKLNVFKGASLTDARGLFNAGLDAKESRGIDFREGDVLDEPALRELVRAAVAHNGSGH